MSLSDAKHPLAQQLVTVIEAVEGGLAENYELPSNIKISYLGPLDSSDGCAQPTVADWETDNSTIIRVPIFSTEENGPLVFFNDQPKLTCARIVIRDFLGRGFRINVGDKVLGSQFTQFDLVDEGIVFHAVPGELSIVQFGEYESDAYSLFADTARDQASLATLHELSVEFLERI
jgi:hypothetical protein